MNRAEQEALIIKYRYLVRSVAYSVSNEAAKDEDRPTKWSDRFMGSNQKVGRKPSFEPLARRASAATSLITYAQYTRMTL